MAKSAFESREDAFHLPALAIFLPGKSASHQSAKVSCHCTVFEVSQINRYNRCVDAEPVSAKSVIGFRIVPAIRQEGIYWHIIKRLFYRWHQIMTIGTRASANQCTGYQMGFAVADNRKFCPSPVTSRMAVLTHYKVPADEMVFQSGRVNAGVTVLFVNQADGAGVIENLCK